MSMGDISTSRSRGSGAPVGTFRGSRRTRVVVEIYAQSTEELPGAFEISDFITDVTTTKSIDGDPGSFSIGLKSRRSSTVRDPLSPFVADRDWEQLISDGDWIGIAVNDGQQQWLVMDGIVDAVQRSVEPNDQGARVDRWRISGRDVTKALAETDLVMAPFAGFNPLLQYGIFQGAVNALSIIPGGADPNAVVRTLFRTVMGADQDRSQFVFWKVPESFPSKSPSAPVPEGAPRQLSDILTLEAQPLEGALGEFKSLMSAPDSGSNAWDLLRSYANLPLNELWIDYAPRLREDAASPLAFATQGDEYSLALTLNHRVRPFPTTEDDGVNWNSLPTTKIDVIDCQRVDVSKDGFERYNYFLMDSGGGTALQEALKVSAALGEPIDDVPCIDQDSVAVHGLRRLEQTSIYVNATDEVSLDIFTGWSRRIRDWYMANPEYLSGEIESAFVLPGVRVGERLILTGLRPEPVEFYVEEIQHQIAVTPTGAVMSASTLSVTRGHPDPVGVMREAVRGFSSARSPLGPSANEEEARARINEALAPVDALLSGEPIEGTDQNGDTVTIPEEE